MRNARRHLSHGAQIFVARQPLLAYAQPNVRTNELMRLPTASQDDAREIDQPRSQFEIRRSTRVEKHQDGTKETPAVHQRARTNLRISTAASLQKLRSQFLADDVRLDV